MTSFKNVTIIKWTSAVKNLPDFRVCPSALSHTYTSLAVGTKWQASKKYAVDLQINIVR